MGCNDKISSRCGKKTSAKCIDYEGTLVQGTALIATSCLNVEEVIIDINTQIKKLIDVTTLDNLTETCIDYNPTGLNITVKEAIKGLNDKVCELVALTKLDSPEDCPSCTNDCAADSCTSNGVIYHSFAAGAFPLSTIGTWVAGITTTDAYSTNLQHVVPSTGKYKITVEVNGVMAASSTAKIGVGINSVAPIETNDVNGYFSSALVVEEGSGNTTLTFIKDLVKGDSLAIKAKLVSGTLYTINSTKIITEKVG
jgi:hypothetical protein